jgi:hypothetical protein
MHIVIVQEFILWVIFIYYSAPTNQDNNLKFLISNELNLTKQFGVKNYE